VNRLRKSRLKSIVTQEALVTSAIPSERPTTEVTKETTSQNTSIQNSENKKQQKTVVNEPPKDDVSQRQSRFSRAKKGRQ